MIGGPEQPTIGVVPESPPGLPQWLASTLHVTPGRDPLGIQTITTDRIVPRLVPGILALSRRARYFSFFAFLLQEYERRQLSASNDGLSAFIKRREYELALAVELCPRGHGGEAVASNGRQRAGPAARRDTDEFDRQESVDSYLGGYGLYYRTPMLDLGLVAPRGTSFASGEGTTHIDVLWRDEERGAALADAFRNSVSETAYYLDYFVGERPIPREVLIAYATRACLCRLDEHPDEQAAIRQVLLVPGAKQPDGDVVRRRQAFAYLIWLAGRDERVARNDAAFRAAVWQTYEDRAGLATPSFQVTRGRWAGLVAKEFVQEGFSTIWAETCRTGLAAGPEGIAAESLSELLIAPMVAPATLDVMGQDIDVGPDRATESFGDAVVASTRGVPLEDVRAWSVADGRALAGLALILATDRRVEDRGEADPGWSESASQDGERQPGLTHFRLVLREHLRQRPTLAETMRWIVTTFVLWPHELIAYGKLPQSTFRFRWESGRLRFYDLAPERFGLTDIRRDPLARIGADIGLLAWTDSGAVPTEAGDAFVAEVFR